jgi:pilus assembly protein CpaF
MSLATRADRVASTGTNPQLVDNRSIGYEPPPKASVLIVVDTVRERLSEVPERVSMNDEQLRALVESHINTVMSQSTEIHSREDSARIRASALDELLGFGPLQDLLNDANISEIMVNGLEKIFVETKGTIQISNRKFDSIEQLSRVIDRMVRTSGRRVDQSSPIVDARLPDGSRLNVVLPPLAIDGPSITIRKFTSDKLALTNLVEQGSISADAAVFMQQAVSKKANILVSGGTGTGKTTILNILSSCIARHERVITVEDAVELTLDLPNLIRLETRPANSEGSGEVSIRDLVKNSLRMRPDRIIVGEVRGAEALDMLQAMNTGHEGSLSTLHANTSRDALRRLETMVLLGGVDLPLRAIREQIASAVDIIVQLTRDATGKRFVSSITEIVGMEGDVVSTAELFHRGSGGANSPLISTGISSRKFAGGDQ